MSPRQTIAPGKKKLRNHLGLSIAKESSRARDQKRRPSLANVMFRYSWLKNGEESKHIIPNVDETDRKRLTEAGRALSFNARGQNPFSKAIKETGLYSEKEVAVLRALEATLPVHPNYLEQTKEMLGNPRNIEIVSRFLRAIQGDSHAEAVLIAMIPDIVDAHQLKADAIEARENKTNQLGSCFPVSKSKKIKEIRRDLPANIRSTLGIIQAIYRSHSLDTYGMLKSTSPRTLEKSSL